MNYSDGRSGGELKVLRKTETAFLTNYRKTQTEFQIGVFIWMACTYLQHFWQSWYWFYRGGLAMRVNAFWASAQIGRLDFLPIKLWSLHGKHAMCGPIVGYCHGGFWDPVRPFDSALIIVHFILIFIRITILMTKAAPVSLLVSVLDCMLGRFYLINFIVNTWACVVSNSRH